jgi:hypothetical protein
MENKGSASRNIKGHHQDIKVQHQEIKAQHQEKKIYI